MRFVPRSAWGASAPRCSTPLSRTAIRHVVYHYSAADSDEQADHANCARRVKGIQTFHMGPSRGWCDIAYNFVVCKHGYVFEGRGLGIRSAATGNANDYTLAVCFLGDDTVGRDDITAGGRQAMVDVAKHIEAWVGRELTYKGHRDFMATTCPGNEIYTYINSSQFRDAVDGDPPLPGPVPKPAYFWAWADWRLGGRQGPRPWLPVKFRLLLAIPRSWPWRALAEWQRRHP